MSEQARNLFFLSNLNATLLLFEPVEDMQNLPLAIPSAGIVCSQHTILQRLSGWRQICANVASRYLLPNSHHAGMIKEHMQF